MKAAAARAATALLTLVLVTCSGAVVGAAPGAASRAAAPGPGLHDISSQLDAALSCPTAAGPGAPVLLVHGTASTPEIAWSRGLQPLLARAGFTVCTIRLPEDAVGDIDIASRYVVASIRRMTRRYDEPVNLIGHSQGGMLLRWVLKWWPDARSLVGDVIGLAPSNHGSSLASSLCLALCPAGIWQQLPDSRFLAALNAGDETPGRAAYSVIYSETDSTVDAPSPVIEGDRDDTNIAVQSICPGREVSHTQIQYDAVAVALVLDALRHLGPARARRIPSATCARKYARGIDEQQADAQQRKGDAFAVLAIATGRQQAAEPPPPDFAAGPAPRPRADVLARALRSKNGLRLRLRAVGVAAGEQWRLRFATFRVAGRDLAVDQAGRVTASLSRGRRSRIVRLDAEGLAPVRVRVRPRARGERNVTSSQPLQGYDRHHSQSLEREDR